MPLAAVERLYTGCRWSEGPVWFGDGRYLLWSDIPNNIQRRWLEEDGHVTVFRHPLEVFLSIRKHLANATSIDEHPLLAPIDQALRTRCSRSSARSRRSA